MTCGRNFEVCEHGQSLLFDAHRVRYEPVTMMNVTFIPSTWGIRTLEHILTVPLMYPASPHAAVQAAEVNPPPGPILIKLAVASETRHIANDEGRNAAEEMNIPELKADKRRNPPAVPLPLLSRAARSPIALSMGV